MGNWNPVQHGTKCWHFECHSLASKYSNLRDFVCGKRLGFLRSQFEFFFLIRLRWSRTGCLHMNSLLCEVKKKIAKLLLLYASLCVIGLAQVVVRSNACSLEAFGAQYLNRLYLPEDFNIIALQKRYKVTFLINSAPPRVRARFFFCLHIVISDFDDIYSFHLAGRIKKKKLKKIVQPLTLSPRVDLMCVVKRNHFILQRAQEEKTTSTVWIPNTGNKSNSTPTRRWTLKLMIFK